MKTRLRYPLFKATYEWFLDQNLTPYFLINAHYPKVMVPRAYVEDGEIILDASSEAIDDMIFDPDGISFSAEFGNEEFRVYFPIDAIISLYAEEDDQGLFTTETSTTLLVQEGPETFNFEPEAPAQTEKKPIQRGHLKLVK